MQQFASAQALAPPSSFRAPLWQQTPNPALSSQLVMPPSVVWTDAASGVLIFAGSRTESKTGTDSQAGTLIFGGSRVETKTGTDSSTGTLIFGGSRVEAKIGADSPTGTLIFSGSATQTKIGSDTQTGTLIFTGTAISVIITPGPPLMPVEVRQRLGFVDYGTWTRGP